MRMWLHLRLSSVFVAGAEGGAEHRGGAGGELGQVNTGCTVGHRVAESSHQGNVEVAQSIDHVTRVHRRGVSVVSIKYVGSAVICIHISYIYLHVWDGLHESSVSGHHISRYVIADAFSIRATVD